MGWPALGNLGKKKDAADFDRCVQHYYRPAMGQCSVCHSPLCEECFGAGSVPICKQCFENPMSPEEAAKARARKTRVAKKPPQKKIKKAAPPKRKAGKKLFSIKASQKKVALTLALSILGPALIILAILTVLGKNPFGIVVPVVAPETRAIQVKMFVSGAVGRIEVYRKTNGKLPESLREIGILDPKSWKYQVISEDQYQIEVAMDGQSFSFNSNQDYRTVFPGMTISEPKRRVP